MLISLETYRTYDFPGGPDPIPPLDPRMHSCLEFKVIF